MHTLHWETKISISFRIEWDMIVVTVFLSILNQMEFYLAKNRKENCHYDHIPFNVKGNGNIILSAYVYGIYVASFETMLCIKESSLLTQEYDKYTLYFNFYLTSWTYNSEIKNCFGILKTDSESCSLIISIFFNC